jgi:hypothetical protein
MMKYLLATVIAAGIAGAALAQEGRQPNCGQECSFYADFKTASDFSLPHASHAEIAKWLAAHQRIAGQMMKQCMKHCMATDSNGVTKLYDASGRVTGTMTGKH